MRHADRSLAALIFACFLGVFAPSAASAAATGHHEHYRSDDTGTAIDNTPLENRRIVIALDAVLGFGRSIAAEQASSDQARPITVFDDHQIFVESFVGSLRVDLMHDLYLRAALPFTFMSFQSDTGRRLGAAALGNASFEGDLRVAHDDLLEHWAILSVFLPTSQGSPPPSGPLDASWENTANRYFANIAALGARGYEELAPWAYDHWSIVPRYLAHSPRGRVGVVYEGSLAWESLFDTSGNANSKYAARLSGWLRGGYAFNDVVDAGLRLGVGAPLHGTDEDKISLTLEPQLRAIGPRLTGVLGVIIPLSGPATSPRFTGIHAGFSLRF